jgi:hypothetical protein
MNLKLFRKLASTHSATAKSLAGCYKILTSNLTSNARENYELNKLCESVSA